MGWLQTCLQLVVWSCWIVDAGCRFSLGSSRGSESWSQNQMETSDGERLPSESYMNTVQLVRKEGYPIEEHQVTTQDGYQLTLHRIPSRNKNAPVVYLQHGFLGASDFWVITPRDQSLAFILADYGYDVWLGNIRGNFYSRKHVTLSPDKSKFWNFSMHEMGVYDVPAMIDHILLTTGQGKIFYVGHSMGTTMFYVMASSRPEYNSKIRLMVALAPVVYFSELRFPILRFVSPRTDEVSKLLGQLGVHELLPRRKATADFAEKYCTEGIKSQNMCLTAYNLIYGENESELNKTALPSFVSHLFSGASRKTLAHYSQIARSGRFQEYDYRPEANIKRYGQSEPPTYDLRRVTAPVSLHYAKADLLVVPQDVRQIYQELANPIGMFEVPQDKFNHLNFILALRVKPLLFDLILELLSRY